MSKKQRKEAKTPFGVTTKELQEVCLHCAFFEIHKTKWPNWKPNVDESVEQQAAFNDLVRSTVKVVAEVFTMISPMDQMQFMHEVMAHYQQMTGSQSPEAKPATFSEVVEMFKASRSVKH